MEFSNFFPIWNKLTATQQDTINKSVALRSAKKGTLIHGGSADCTGLLVVRSGQIRAYILSDEGRQISIYRLFERDMCLFSAACIMNSIQFDIMIEAQKDTEFWLIPPEIYKNLMNESTAVSNYTNEIMAARFSDVVWLLEQIMWKSLDKRVASFLLDEAIIEDSLTLKITHEAIANHLGTHREVVTRMMRYLQNEGLIKVGRGTVEILSKKNLEALTKA